MRYKQETEPGKRERYESWRTAIGLQAVDALMPSKYLLETAKRHIEGDLSIDQVKALISSYYEENPKHDKNGSREADLVSARIEEIRNYSYKELAMPEIIRHLAKFVARLWQNHIFGEGNTRTTAVFLIKYLRTLGFETNNESFADHSWYFRNALVRANYNDLQKGVHETTEYWSCFYGIFF